MKTLFSLIRANVLDFYRPDDLEWTAFYKEAIKLIILSFLE